MKGELIFMACAFKCDRCGKYKDLGGPNWHNNQKIITTRTAKECLKNYLDYEWKDELYG